MAEGSVTSLLKKRRVLSWTGAALVAGILVAANFLANYFPLRFDYSAGRVYSLSKGTKLLLKDIDDTLLIRVMFSPDLPPKFKLNEQYIRDLLQEYQKDSHGKIRIERINPGVDMKTKQEAISAGVFPVQLDVIEKDKREIKECFMGLSLLYGDKKEAVSFIQDTQGLEYEITQRIKKLVHPTETTIGFVADGNGLTLNAGPLQQMDGPIRQIYNTAIVDLNKEVPSNIKSLWLIGPSTVVSTQAINNLRSYVQNGGFLGLMDDRYEIAVEAFRPRPVANGLDDLLKEWGIDVQRSMIVDPRCDRIQIRTTQGMYSMINIIDYPYFPLSNDLNRSNPATKPLDAVSFPFASPVFVSAPKDGLTYTPLVQSSPRSWLDSNAANVSPLQEHPKPQSAPSGPFNLVLLVEGKFKKDDPHAPVGRVMVFGCSRFIRTDYPPKQSNYTLFFNLLDWSSQDEFLLGIRSKGAANRPLRDISDPIRPLIKILLMVGLPILSLLIGFIVWTKSKQRQARSISLYAGGS